MMHGDDRIQKIIFISWDCFVHANDRQYLSNFSCLLECEFIRVSSAIINIQLVKVKITDVFDDYYIKIVHYLIEHHTGAIPMTFNSSGK